jgi:ABC-type antimicrobial peptide transport system permease subunit
VAVGGVFLTLAALASTTISVVLTPGTAAAGVGLMAFCSLAAGLRAISKLAKVEPAEAFRT